MDNLYSTIEPQHLVRAAFPDLVQAYELSKVKPKKPSKRRKKVADPVHDLENQLANTSITEEPPIKKKNKRGGKKEPKGKTIESYFKKAVINSFNKANTPAKEEQTYPSNTEESWLDLDRSRFGDESDFDLDLSDIMDEIVQRKCPTVISDSLEKLGYQLATVNNCDSEESEDLNSSFFISTPIDDDPFERSLLRVRTSDSEDDDEERDNINLDVDGDGFVQDEGAVAESRTSEQLEETFTVDYVPLFERITSKV